MAEPTLKEQENSSPYDLWPDEQDAPHQVLPAADPIVEESRKMGEMPFEAPFVPVVYTPETTEENVRNSGLAWSAGIVFFGSVAFMLFIGWGADLLLGSSPWGLVLGIIIGAIIGFIQFFRISSRIYAPNKSSGPKSIMSDHNED
jgi:F0F1-type ATP synthase assembly protein I